MAEWKKVVVSGSAISQLNNDASYIAQDDSNVSLSGSFSGSFFGDGSGLSGVAASFPVSTATANDALKYFVNDGASKYVTGTTLSNYVYGKISGDATVAAGGALTIANSAVEGTMLNSNVADGTTITLSSNTLSTLKVPNALTAGSGLSAAGTFDGADARTFSVDSASMATYFRQDAYSNVSGDITIASNGVATIAADSVVLGTDTTGNYVATLGTGTGVTIGSNTGEGSTPTITVDYGATANTAVQGNTSITFAGTANEITIDGGSSITLGNGGTVTYGLADSIGGARTFTGDITFASDIVVQGTASFQNTTNLEVADQFILLNSGSSTDNSPGGIIIQQNTQDQGVAFAYDAAADSNNGRWGTTDAVNASGTTFSADAYVSYVIDIDAGQSDIAKYQQNGNIKVDSGEIWIYA